MSYEIIGYVQWSYQKLSSGFCSKAVIMADVLAGLLQDFLLY